MHDRPAGRAETATGQRPARPPLSRGRFRTRRPGDALTGVPAEHMIAITHRGY